MNEQFYFCVQRCLSEYCWYQGKIKNNQHVPGQRNGGIDYGVTQRIKF